MESDILAPVAEMVEVGTRFFLTVPFGEYTVTEGFLLLFFLALVVWLCIQFFKGGF